MNTEVSDTGYGVDVSARRADDLEKKLLHAVMSLKQPSVLDLGCGAGGAAARLIAAGARVTGVDQHDFSAAWSSFPQNQARFIHGDIGNVLPSLDRTSFDFVLCNRTIHYVPYEKANALLGALAPYIHQQLLISFSGLESDLGRGYFDKDKAIEARFARLTAADQVTFGITEPICLYTPREAAQLLTEAGYTILELYVSAFQNVKAIVCPR